MEVYQICAKTLALSDEIGGGKERKEKGGMQKNWGRTCDVCLFTNKTQEFPLVIRCLSPLAPSSPRDPSCLTPLIDIALGLSQHPVAASLSMAHNVWRDGEPASSHKQRQGDSVGECVGTQAGPLHPKALNPALVKVV